MKQTHYVNKKGIKIKFITIFLMGALWFITGALCIKLDYSEYVFGALFITILLVFFPIYHFFGITSGIEISRETIKLIDYSRYGFSITTLEVKNHFLSELKKGSYRFFLKHENGNKVLLPRYVHKGEQKYELFLLENKVSVKRFVQS